MLENSSVDGECFKMKTHVKNVSGIWINADVAQDQKGIGQIWKTSQMWQIQLRMGLVEISKTSSC